MQVFGWKTPARNESEGCLLTSVVGTLLFEGRGTIDRSSLVIDLSRSISVAVSYTHLTLPTIYSV